MPGGIEWYTTGQTGFKLIFKNGCSGSGRMFFQLSVKM